ncbi:MAG TPA: hypothetical protein VK548_12325 [Candidatus Acidoferrum sp.]|nr:hypothetical protein [Candidatus Acidoferrum sp.]
MSSRRRPLLPLLAAAVYAAVLVWQAPHTVHHFFEHDAEKQNECAPSATAERSAGTTVAPISLVPVAGLELAIAPTAPDVFARPTPSVHGPRAPPSPAV